jgi:ribonuclease HI
LQYNKVHQYANEHGGSYATAHLEEVFANETFKVTGICPDDMMAKVRDTRRQDIEQVKQSIPMQEHMIDYGTEDLVYELYNGEWHATAYTDGSLYDPNSQYFARSGWGFYVNKDHRANLARPLLTPHPSVFRAELRALLHAVQVCGVPTLVRSDCKSACQLANSALLDGKYDSKHDDADILSRIAEVANKNCIIQWMPAHLDEEKYKIKREKYIANGGTIVQIESNCCADELAKQGADMIEVDEQCYFRFKVRKWLTRIVQNMLVDIWSTEKERMYGTPKLIKVAQDDEDAINLMMNDDIEQEEFDAAYGHYEEDGDDFCDINGNIIPVIRATSSNETAVVQAANQENQAMHHLPEINDNDNDINVYLHSTYPMQCVFVPTVKQAVIEVQDRWTYEQFPLSCKASYSNDDNKIVQWTIKRHRWEPYQWFFETLQWSTEVGSVAGQGSITFSELAILAHFLTDGATSDKQDICIITKLMKAAFQKYHKQRFLFNGNASDYQRTFGPESKLKNLVYLGVEQIPGVRRRPFISEELQDHIRVSIWKAAQHGRATPHRQFGQGVFVPNLKIGIFVPNVIMWAQTMCDANVDAKKGKSTSLAATAFVMHQPKVMPKQSVCFYGHRSTSSVDAKGRQVWRRPPKASWPGVPPGRTLCQKCYEAHRIAAERDESQSIIQRLFIYDGDENSLGSSMATEESNRERREQCEVCAIDVIEHDISHETELHWYRLCFNGHCHSTDGLAR